MDLKFTWTAVLLSLSPDVFAALRVGAVLQNGLWDVAWMLEFLLGPVGGGPLRPEGL